MIDFNNKDPKIFVLAVLVVIGGLIIAAQFILPEGFYGTTNILRGLHI